MKASRGRRLVLVLFSMLVGWTGVQAGKIHGSLVAGGRPVAAGLQIVIGCPTAETTEEFKGATAEHGRYSILVARAGKCYLRIPSYQGEPSHVIYSHGDPQRYDFELKKLPDGNYTLQRR